MKPPQLTRILIVGSTLQFLIILIALVFAIFTVALDGTIIVTAIPRITDDYKSLGDVGWYGSAFSLPSSVLVPLFGKFYAFFSTKWTFLAALFVFEVGSLISAVASSSVVFIVGRAISGAGSAGIFNGALVTISKTTPMSKRPAYQSIIGGTYAIATITAPVIGGAFTDYVSWRWCFYINLPIGALAAAMLVFVLRLPAPPKHSKTWSQLLWSLDLVGQLLFLPSITCILIALQWAGTTYAWSSARIIALLVVFIVLFIAFVANELYMGDEATVPPRIATKRNVAASSIFSFFNYSQFFIFVYFIPLYFQGVKGVDAQQSGIDTIPLIVANNIASLTSGILTTVFGTYVQYFYLCSVLTSVGAGLMTTWQVYTSSGTWIGCQILSGFGTGLALALPQISVQPSLAPQDIPIGISMTIFCQFFGTALFVSIGNNIVNTKFVDAVRTIGIPGFDANRLVQAGATELRRTVDVEYLPQVLEAYNGSLRWAFRAGVIMAALSIVPALFLEWKNLKKPDEEGAVGASPEGKGAEPLREDVVKVRADTLQ
ncbi:MFS general substrate transporter [Lentithecium fluviatile CBS 122367]|uniref:MFS general substrate transporter n=1 Tax=Lentithecium fluviatile CBS 122367 TaxID=1168545 RepID=A0A6G1JD57_9PLEO|nr:MFS general substrate transporter [Lentithecium fluviatile CBS 122367]